MLLFDHIGFSYGTGRESGASDTGSSKSASVLSDVSLEVHPGEHVVLLGANGSGKSTLARLANGTILPQTGRVVLASDGTDDTPVLLDTADDEMRIALRRHVGVVDQDPETQIVSSRVIDEVAFGPENLGLSRECIRMRVDEALELVGLTGMELRDPSTLSGGERQRLVVADACAMNPDYLVLDEPTSMLDTRHRADIDRIIGRLRAEGCGILHITHDLEDCLDADRIYVLSGGCIVCTGDFDELAQQRASWCQWGIAPSWLLGFELERRAEKQRVPLTTDVDVLARALGLSRAQDKALGKDFPRFFQDGTSVPCEDAHGLVVEDISYVYEEGSTLAHQALSAVSFSMPAASLLLVAGVTGSGKSTLLRLLAGLYEVQTGRVGFDGKPPRPGICGMVFQNPENQLFADTVGEDILFGPENLGQVCRTPKDDPRRHALVAESLDAVGLDNSTVADRSPFALSGGQMRRVAIAGVLAMHPRVLLFDEPTAGLDATGRMLVTTLIAEQVAAGTTVVVVSHDLEGFLPLADRILLLAEGAPAFFGDLTALERNPSAMERAGLELPSFLALRVRYGFTGVEEVQGRCR